MVVDEKLSPEFDELEESPPASPSLGTNRKASTTERNLSSTRGGRGGRVLGGAVTGTHRKSASDDAKKFEKARKVSRYSLDLPKPIDEMTLEEIEALPAAKRRKGLKARGAAGPGRGWRKGLKMYVS